MENKKKAPLLSVCIPTYNQPESIKKLLNNITIQETKNIEIIIKDDSSDNKTECIVKKYKSSLPIFYFRGVKTGVDPALLFLAERARGKYVWWVGDDTLANGAIAKITSVLIKNPDISLLFINSREINSTASALNLGGDHFFKDKNEALEEIGDLLGFISALILERKHLISGLVHAKKHVGSAWVSLYLILHVLSQEGRYYFLSTSYILSNSRDPSIPVWYDGFNVFALNLFHIVKEFEGRFAKRSIKRMLSNNLNGIWKGIVVYRAKGYSHGLGSKDSKIWPLFKLYWSFGQFWLALPFLLLPRWADRVLYFLYRKIRGK